jgi:hypothetical protein
VTFAWWQRVLLLIVLLTAGMTLVELLLLGHVEEWEQLIPVVLLVFAIMSTMLVLLTAKRWAIQVMRFVLGVCLVSALVGLYFHYRANTEFVLERHPDLKGFGLFKSAMMGGMPALAPGAMAQIALIGWLATWPRRSV